MKFLIYLNRRVFVMWVKNSTPDILKYIFLIFPKKEALTYATWLVWRPTKAILTCLNCDKFLTFIQILISLSQKCFLIFSPILIKLRPKSVVCQDLLYQRHSSSTLLSLSIQSNEYLNKQDGQLRSPELEWASKSASAILTLLHCELALCTF